MKHNQHHSCQKFSGEETLWRQPRRARRRMPLSLTGAIDVISAIQADFAVQKVGLKYIFEYFISTLSSPSTVDQTAENLLLEMAGSIGWLMASIYISLDVSGNKRRKHVKTCPICCLSGPKWPSGSYLALKPNLYNCILITPALAMQCNAFLSHMQYPSCTLKCTALHC